jgi:hypothetical protein
MACCSSVQWNRSISETVRSRTLYMYTFFFLRRIADIVTSGNIDLSSWDTLYIYFCNFFFVLWSAFEKWYNLIWVSLKWDFFYWTGTGLNGIHQTTNAIFIWNPSVVWNMEQTSWIRQDLFVHSMLCRITSCGYCRRLQCFSKYG